MKSHAQVGNDILISYLLNKTHNVRYVDIGCLFPVVFSNTYFFYERGGRGLCIDPNPNIAKIFKDARPNDTFMNVGIDLSYGNIDYYMHDNPVYNTFSKERAKKLAQKFKRKPRERYRLLGVEKIKVMPLPDAIAQSGTDPADFDFITIDVEGFEDRIIKSIDFETFRPTVICMEYVSETDTALDVYESDTAQLLKDKGYRIAAFTGHDVYFKRS